MTDVAKHQGLVAALTDVVKHKDEQLVALAANKDADPALVKRTQAHLTEAKANLVTAQGKLAEAEKAPAAA